MPIIVGYSPELDTRQPVKSSTDPENPPPRAPAAIAAPAERQGGEGDESLCMDYICKCTIFVVFVCVLLGSGFWLVRILAMMPQDDPRYSAGIDSFSGLANVRTDLAMDPEFNLTLRVASVSSHENACVDPGTYVEVAYRCVTLATSATAQQRLCAGPREAAEQKLVARGTGVRVPGTVLDSLAADMRQGAPVFQVTIRWSGGDYADDMFVASCGGRRVGAASDDLGVACNAWHLCP